MAASTEEKRTCPIHDKPLTYSRKLRKWYCKDCLFSSFLTYQAQQAAVKRYRQSKKGKEAERKYELSNKGKEARDRYLKSEKYKEARKAYNERLKESLRIARLAQLERATKEKDVEIRRTEESLPLIQDIREYLDVMGRTPEPAEVIIWADAYGITLTHKKASELIKRAQQKRAL